MVSTTERIRTTEVAAHAGERVRVAGWLHTLRRMGGITFLIVRDGWGMVQTVVEDTAALAPLAETDAGAESVIAVAGRAELSPQAPGGVELRAPRIEVITPVREAPPVTLGKREPRAGLATLLDTAAVTNRHPTRRALLRLGSLAVAGFRETLDTRGFTEVHTPKLVAAATESGANVFSLDYFGRPAYLAQSPQFFKQIMVGVYERVYEVGPVFRAEPHDTTRHLNEYVSLDAEMGFIESHFTVMTMLRDVIAGIIAALRERGAADLRLLGVTLPDVAARIPHIHFTEAQELIFRLQGVDVRGEPDLSPQDERWIGEWALREHGSEFVFVTGYPTHHRAFYTAPDPSRPGYSYAFDLLFRGMELVSGSQRLHRYEDYIAVLAERGLPREPFAALLEAMRYGMPPHGGFAIGLERLIALLAGLPNVKLAATFPRDLHRLAP
jgi:nondiscriminating aspartyl-tRNA synthetase